MVFQFHLPCTVSVIGSSQSGKTTLIRHIIDNADKFFKEPIDVILWFHHHDSNTSQIPTGNSKLMAIEGPPDIKLIREHRGKSTIIVLDDLQSHFSRDKKGREMLNDLFCVHAHHLNCAIFNLVQSAFLLDRTSRINSTYLILLRNHSDKMQVKTILMQQFGDEWRTAMEAFEDALEKPYSHLLIDSHPRANPKHRLLTNITDENPTVYISRG